MINFRRFQPDDKLQLSNFGIRCFRKTISPMVRFRIARAGCWFVDIPATSSTSCKAELERKFGWPYGKDDKKYSSLFLLNQPDHMTAMEIRYKLRPDLWQKMFTFSIIRNPWARYLSLWQINRQMGFLAPSKKVRENFKWHFITMLGQEKTFMPADCYLLNGKDETMVDYIAQYENRQEDLAHIGSRIGFPEFGTQFNIAMRVGNDSKYHYSEYYDTVLRDIITEISQWEIEKYNYSFKP